MEDYNSSDTTVPWDSLKDNICEVMISTDTEGSGVTHIGENAFYACKNLQKVTIADSIVSIGDGAFDSCSVLKEISLPNTVTSIGAWCFYQCKALNGITLPSQLTAIGDSAFEECKSLESVTIPASVTSIGVFAFLNCESLQEVTIQEGSKLETIGDYAFSGTAIDAFEMPDTVTTLGLGAFQGAANLKAVVLSSSLTVICGWTFNLCPITSIRIPSGVTDIRAGAFLNCTELTQIYFEGNQPTVDLTNANPQDPPFDGVTATVQYPLGGTGWSDGIPENWGGTLTMDAYGAAEGTCGDNLNWMLGADGTLEITGSGAMTDYTYGLMGGETAPWLAYEEIEITKVIIGDEVTSVGDYAFYACHQLKEIQLGDSLTSIGTYAFGECIAAQLMIPASVTEIETEAFRDSALTSILFKGNLPECGANAFAVNPSLVEKVTVTYPEENTSWAGAAVNSLGGVPDDYSDIEYVFSNHEHIWDSGTETKAATCTVTGSKRFTCTVCEATKDEPISMLAHSWNSGVVTTAAQCTTKGVKTYTCSSCKGTKTEPIAATGHTAGSWQISKNADCTNTGTKVQKCTKCSIVLNSQTISAYGHSWSVWNVVSDATVFEPKKEMRYCAVCKTEETRTVGSALTPTVSLNTSNLPIQVGKTTTALKVQRIQNGDYVVSWSSSKPAVAAVNTKTGKITAKKVGKTKITVTTAAGATHTITVSVQKAAVKSKFMSIVGDTKHTVAKGKKLDLIKTMQPTVYPLTTSEKLTFTSSNKKIATVSSKGVVTAKAAGTVKITMKSGKAKEVVTIVVPKTKTTKITGVKTELSLKKGKSYTLKPKLAPSNSDEKITYSTSSKKIATVSSKGKITAKKKGTATITVKSGSVSVKCKVTVK